MTEHVHAEKWGDQPGSENFAQRVSEFMKMIRPENLDGETVEIDPATATTVAYDGGVAELIDGEWVITSTFSYDDGQQRVAGTQLNGYRLSNPAIRALERFKITHLDITLGDGPSAGHVVKHVPVNALNINIVEYTSAGVRQHYYSMDGKYLSSEDVQVEP